MKTRISKLYFGDGVIRYTIQHKEHWWQKWYFMMDGQYPRLFTSEEVILLGYESVLQRL